MFTVDFTTQLRGTWEESRGFLIAQLTILHAGIAGQFAAMQTVQTALVTHAVGVMRSRAWRSTAQSIANNTNTAIVFDMTDYDVGGVHSTTVNPSRFTIPVGGAGLWLIMAQGDLVTAAAARVQLFIFKNGAMAVGSFDLQLAAPTVHDAMQVHVVDLAAAGDYYEVVVYQNTGGAVNTNSGSTVVYATATRLS